MPIWVEKVLREYLRLGENRVRIDTVVQSVGLDDRPHSRSTGHEIIHNLCVRGVLEERRTAHRLTYRIRPDLVSDIQDILSGPRGAVSHSGRPF